MVGAGGVDDEEGEEEDGRVGLGVRVKLRRSCGRRFVPSREEGGIS